MVFWTTVPKAPINEDSDLLLEKDKIRLPTQVEFRPAMHTVPQT